MDALILTCGTGGGHNTAAQGLREELHERGHAVQVLNPFRLKSDKLADAIDQSYIELAKKAPSLFGRIYHAGDQFQKLPFRSPIYHFNAFMVRTLEEHLQSDHFDVILMTHFYSGHILTHMKYRGLSVPPHVMIATDYTCIPTMEEIESDAFVTPAADLNDEFLRRGKTPDQLYPFGIPVRKDFEKNIPKAEARAVLNLDVHKRYALVAGGSMGAGALDELLTELYKAASLNQTELIVICGSNEALYQKLKQQYGETIHLVGQTDQMAAYMYACDVLFTKPGGLTSTEAAVVGIPMVHTTPIPGCETKNQLYFEKYGMSIAAHTPSEAAAALKKLQDPDQCKQMIARQRAHINSKAASDICDLAEKLASAREEKPE